MTDSSQRKEQLQTYLYETQLAVLNPQNTGEFHAAIRAGMGLGVVTEEQLAHRFSASRTSIQRWNAGRGAPHPVLRPTVYNYLIECASNILKEFND